MDKQIDIHDIHRELNKQMHKDYNIDRKKVVHDFLAKQLDEGNRLLLITIDRYNANPAAVVTIDKLYPNFALGHLTNRLSGAKIPYTINYYSLITKNISYKTYRPESQTENGDTFAK